MSSRRTRSPSEQTAASTLHAIVAAACLVASLAASGAMTAAERAALLAPTTEFSSAERWEAFPGGSATNRTRLDREAFSQPSANLSFARRADFSIGNGLFRRAWVSSPSSTAGADGLGPLYNARSCQRCHLKDGREHPPAGPHDSAVSMFLRLSVPPRREAERTALAAHRIGAVPEPVYGGQLQDLAVPGQVGEGRMRVDYRAVEVRLAGGEIVTLRDPAYRIEDLGYGPFAPDVMLSPRVAPPMTGIGLLEAIDAADVLARADPEDTDQDGISGRANRAWSEAEGRVMLGRFGWKAGNATVADQAGAAMAGDIGISNPLAPRPWGDCTEAQAACRAGPHGAPANGLEAPREVMDAIVFYSRNLAVPVRRGVAEPTVLRGQAQFYRAGCIACHTPKHATRRD